MELSEALRTTGSVREFTTQPVDDALIYEILDEARFAPSGGNRQAWRVLVIKDTAQRRAIGSAYLEAWHDYVAHLLAGVVPFSPLASEEDRAAARDQRAAALARSRPDGFAETFGEVPMMLVICVDLGVLAATDRDLDRYHFAGGASIYPFVWNILLAARSRGLGGVMTTMATRNEPRLAEILDLPTNYAVASVVALGYPQQRHTKLTRKTVSEFTTVDTFGGEAFTA
jgi:nitroreductase